MWTRKTIRKMSPVTRETAKLLNELDSVHTRLCNHLGKIADLELENKAIVSRARKELESDYPVSFRCFFCSAIIAVDHISLIIQTKCPHCGQPVISRASYHLDFG